MLPQISVLALTLGILGLAASYVSPFSPTGSPPDNSNVTLVTNIPGTSVEILVRVGISTFLHRTFIDGGSDDLDSNPGKLKVSLTIPNGSVIGFKSSHKDSNNDDLVSFAVVALRGSSPGPGFGGSPSSPQPPPRSAIDCKKLCELAQNGFGMKVPLLGPTIGVMISAVAYSNCCCDLDLQSGSQCLFVPAAGSYANMCSSCPFLGKPTWGTSFLNMAGAPVTLPEFVEMADLALLDSVQPGNYTSYGFGVTTVFDDSAANTDNLFNSNGGVSNTNDISIVLPSSASDVVATRPRTAHGGVQSLRDVVTRDPRWEFESLNSDGPWSRELSLEVERFNSNHRILWIDALVRLGP